MPQITTWLIVSEQMSRLSEIWAWLFCKLPSSPTFSQVAQNLLIKPRTESRISDLIWPRRHKIVKKERKINNKANKKNRLRCSLLYKNLTPPPRINNEIDLFV